VTISAEEISLTSTSFSFSFVTFSV